MLILRPETDVFPFEQFSPDKLLCLDCLHAFDKTEGRVIHAAALQFRPDQKWM